MVILRKFLDHKGGFYHYKLHRVKTNNLVNGFDKLRGYLYDIFENCPDNYFNSGPRSSSLKFNIKNLDLFKVKGHEVCGLTEQGLKHNRDNYNSNHSKVQSFMLEMDDKTIAVEVPIWLENGELKEFKELFNSEEPLTGHIDVLRVEDGKIWIWDYKPNCLEEKYASTQVYFYAYMLSKRTDVELENFRCGYFDCNYAFMFKPVDKIKFERYGKLINFI